MSNDSKNYERKGSSESKSSKPYYPGSKPKKSQKNSVVPGVNNKPVEPRAIEKAYAKVPVVLGETTIQIDLDAKIDFPEPVLEIKKIKKHLKLTQCRLLLPTNKLFIKGFVRKNIQYATPKHSNRHQVLSSIHSLTVDIPFEAVTEIDFLNKPHFESNPDTRDFTFFTASKLPQGQGFSQKEKLLSADFSQYDQISGEVFNELPFCELISSKFIEYDEALDRKMGTVFNHNGECMEAPFEEGTFTKIEEKMVVEITLKVLQNQQVHIDRGGHYPPHSH
ncbi:CsxC family protein (plasmid) [Pseudalkalibacillus hwajinpoensis]|uniref:CsxC family protein n=1 Tax=Guptibacillus hwajinpoensis TaxID=208199 RepID=UPI00325BC42A